MRTPPGGTASQTVVSTFENNGLFYGALIGALVGVLIAGPHFSDWSIQKILATIAVSSAVIGTTAHFSVWIAYAAIGAGPMDHDDIEEEGKPLDDGVHVSED